MKSRRWIPHFVHAEPVSDQATERRLIYVLAARALGPLAASTPAERAECIAPVRVATPSFLYAFLRCHLTVSSPIPSVAETSLLTIPSSIRRRIWSSRTLSGSINEGRAASAPLAARLAGG